MHRDKIEAALSKALNHLEEAISFKTANIDNDEALESALWAASAETEYAVFLLALVQSERPEGISTKRSSTAKQSAELDIILTSAVKLLKNAKTRVEEENFKESHKAAWSARNKLLKAQELLEKRHKTARK